MNSGQNRLRGKIIQAGIRTRRDIGECKNKAEEAGREIKSGGNGGADEAAASTAGIIRPGGNDPPHPFTGPCFCCIGPADE